MSRSILATKSIVSREIIYRTESVTITTLITDSESDFKIQYIRTVHTKNTYDDSTIEYIEDLSQRKHITVNYSDIPSVLEIAPGVMMSKAAAAGFIKAYGDTLT